MPEKTLARNAGKSAKFAPGTSSDLALLVHDVSRLRKTFLDKVLKPIGITGTQWWLMRELSRLETGGISQSDLAIVMRLSKVTVGAMIALLDNCGYVERRSHDHDGRAKYIFITPMGVKALEQARRMVATANRAIMSGVADDNVAIAEAVMRGMKENLLSLHQDMQAD